MGQLLIIDFSETRDRAERDAYRMRREALDERRGQDNALAGAEWPEPAPAGPLVVVALCALSWIVALGALVLLGRAI